MLRGLDITRKKLTYLKQILSVLRKRSFRPASNLCLTVTMLQDPSASLLLLHDLAIRHSPKVCRSYYYMILNRGKRKYFYAVYVSARWKSQQCFHVAKT